ncbi:Inositol-1,4,5-trisphosphate 5-phosphatase 1, partial [Linderina pennispora]
MEAKRFFVYTRSQPRAVGLVPVSALDDPAASFLSIKVHRVTSDSDEDVQIEVNRESVQQSLRMYSPLDIDPVYGIVGILDYLNDTHLFLVKACQPVCNLAELRGEQKTVFRILRVTSLSLVDSTYDMLASNRPMGSMDDHATGEMDVYGITNPCAQLNSFLENGAFYFSPSFDLTRSLQSQRLNAMVNEEPGVRDPDEKFHWNSNMLKAIMDYRLHMLSHEERRQFDQDGFVVSLIQGHVGAVYLDALGNLTGTPRSAHMSVFLISRSSSQRSGARFLTRGINDAGAVANEVESEVIIATPQLTFAHVQVRGSVPLFWTQDGFQIGSHRVQVTRSLKASLPATKRHFADLLDRYKRVNVVNLLRMHYVQSYEDMAGGASTGNSGSSEADLGQMYRQQVLAMGLPNELLLYTAYDYNNEVRGGQFDRVKDLVQEIKSLMADYQYFLVDTTSDTILSLQRGVQRTNCLDCLDRTNVVQSVISRYVSGEFIEQNALLSRSAARNAVQHIGSLWGANGNAISRLYAGTGALKNSVTTSGKSGWSGFLSDATKSLSRLMQNNFQDKGKQD